MWGARPDQVWAIDPKSNRITRRVPLDDLSEILALDIDADEAWIAARRPGRIGTVVQLDLKTAQVVSKHAVSLPAGVRITPDRAWVTSYDTNELVGFDRD